LNSLAGPADRHNVSDIFYHTVNMGFRMEVKLDEKWAGMTF